MIHHSDVSSPPFGLIFVSYICSWLTLTLCVSAVLSADVIPQPEGTADIKNLKLKDLVQTAQNRVKNALQQAKSASKSIGLAWGHLGNVYHVHGWETEAILCYQQAAELDPEAFRWFYLLGLLTYTTNPRAAAVSLHRAIEINPQYVPAYVYHVQALRRMGEIEAAKKQLQRLQQLDASNPYVHLWLGEVALGEKRFEVARHHLQTALKHNPHQSEAHAKISQAYLALGNAKLAKPHAEQARFPSWYREIDDPVWLEVTTLGVTSRWFVERGMRYNRQGDFQRAVDQFSVVISVAQDDPDICLNYGIALYHTQRYTEAAIVLENALVLTSQIQDAPQGAQSQRLRAECYNHLGLIYRQVDQTKRSINHLQKAVDLFPADTEYRRHLADVYWQAKMYDRAAEQYQRLLRVHLQPGRPRIDIPPLIESKTNVQDEQVLYRLGLALLQKGQLDSAISYFNRVLSINPGHTQAHGALGVIFFQQEKWQQAVDEFDTILRLEPNNRHARSMLAQIGGLK